MVEERDKSILEGENEVFRVALNSSQYDKNAKRFHMKAFLRRVNDPNGLSVYLKKNISLDDIIRKFDKVYAVGTLKISDIRSIVIGSHLDVVQKQHETEHANIDGLPPFGEDVELAEELAQALMKICKTEYQK